MTQDEDTKAAGLSGSGVERLVRPHGMTRAAWMLMLRQELTRLEREAAEEALQETQGSVKDACRALLRAGLHIGAIKHYRNTTGCTLREAKYAIDAMRSAA